MRSESSMETSKRGKDRGRVIGIVWKIVWQKGLDSEANQNSLFLLVFDVNKCKTGLELCGDGADVSTELVGTYRIIFHHVYHIFIHC